MDENSTQHDHDGCFSMFFLSKEVSQVISLNYYMSQSLFSIIFQRFHNSHVLCQSGIAKKSTRVCHMFFAALHMAILGWFLRHFQTVRIPLLPSGKLT